MIHSISSNPSLVRAPLEVVKQSWTQAKEGRGCVHPLKVLLEDLYNGTSKKLSLSRNVICSKCKGKGSKSGASMKCAGCQGSGMKVSIRQLGPSMIQQMQHPCNAARAQGVYACLARWKAPAKKRLCGQSIWLCGWLWLGCVQCASDAVKADGGNGLLWYVLSMV